jgi:hypothetical protein
MIADWRGTPIEVGSKILYHGNSSYSTGIGTIASVEGGNRGSYVYGSAQIDWHEHCAHSNKKSQPVLLKNITVLTKDMLDSHSESGQDSEGIPV